MKTFNKIREASHAGSWYVGEGKYNFITQLKHLMHKSMIFLIKLNKIQFKILKLLQDRKYLYFIIRHAGFSYSGPTAAFAY